ncbi:MAG: hypothetical protein RMY36_017920 [Nostoc sp. SerVER01]|nr:hypothetical protein [Nostoc sp. DcaGUA01]
MKRSTVSTQQYFGYSGCPKCDRVLVLLPDTKRHLHKFYRE